MCVVRKNETGVSVRVWVRTQKISWHRSSYLVNFRNRPIKHLTNNNERYSYLRSAGVWDYIVVNANTEMIGLLMSDLENNPFLSSVRSSKITTSFHISGCGCFNIIPSRMLRAINNEN